MMRLPFTGNHLGQRVLAGIHITDIESAINYWRSRTPSTGGMALPAPTRALAEVYARMVYDHVEKVEEASLSDVGRAAWLQWYASTPDTPASPFALPAREMNAARDAGAPLTRCSTGRPWERSRSARSGGESPWRERRGASTNTLSGPQRETDLLLIQ